jgi:uncharacterized membrane protein YdjX (TVP38/TMEM64 family)
MPKKRDLFILVLLIIAILIIRFLPIKEWFSLELFHVKKEMLQLWVQRNYLMAVGLFIVAYIFTVALAIPGVALLTIASGALFGILPALIYVNVGTTIGSLLTFFSSRFYFGEWIQNKYAKELKAFNAEFDQRGFVYLILVRFQPFLHIFVENAFAGLTKVSIVTFIWTTMVGILPGTLLMILLGGYVANVL